jgi:hypothetical protein
MQRGLVVAIALAGCGWSHREVALEAAFAVETLVDYHQTLGVTRACDETNPFMEPCGTGTPPALYFPLTYVLHLSIAALLPERARLVFQATTLGVEGHTIATNVERGYGF